MRGNDRITALREAISSVTQILAGRGITVTQQGTSAYVENNRKGEPTRVNIPHLPDDASESLISAIRGFIDHEVGHLLFSDFKLLNEGKAKGVGFEHNALEDTFIERKMRKRFRGSDGNIESVLKFYLERHNQPKFEQAVETGNLGEILSALFVPMIRAWSGQKAAQDYMADKWEHVQPVVDAIGQDVIDRIEGIDSTQDALDVALALRDRLRPPEDENESSDEGDDGDDTEGKGSGERSDSDESNDESMGNKADSDKSKKPKSESDGEDEDEGGSGGKSDDKEEGEDDKGEDDKDGSGSDSEDGGEDEKDGSDSDSGDGDESEADGEGSKGGNSLGDDESGESDGMSKNKSDEGSPERNDDTGEPENAEQSEPGGGVGASGLPPMDYDQAMRDADDFAEMVAGELSEDSLKAMRSHEYRVFTTDGDFFDVWNPRRVDHSTVAEMEDRVDHMVGLMQKDLERIVATKTRSRWLPGQRRGRINGSALSRLALGAQSHALNDDRVFKTREEAKSLDTAVTLLVDCSGSMYGGGRRGGRSKIGVAADAAYALSSTLERIGVANEIVGFTTKDMPYDVTRRQMAEESEKGITYSRIEALNMPILKTFNERVTPTVKGRIAMVPRELDLCNNIDGESLWAAALELAKRREEGKFIIVISDGEPAAYSPKGMHVFTQDLKRRVSDVEELGINVLGIGVMSKAVRRFYDKHVVLDNVEELPTTIMGELRRIVEGR